MLSYRIGVPLTESRLCQESEIKDETQLYRQRQRTGSLWMKAAYVSHRHLPSGFFVASFPSS